jgi:hypothetical protein
MDESTLRTSDEIDIANAIISIPASICRTFLTLTAFISRLEMLNAISARSRPFTDGGVAAISTY